MNGICSAHKHYEPGCKQCEATMTKEEINREVAEKVMGFHLERTIIRAGSYASEGLGWFNDNSELISLLDDWNPSERIDHAWMVQAKIEQLGVEYEYCGELIKQCGGEDDLWPLINATPEQRCRAALEVVKEK